MVKVGEVAERAGVNIETIRYYERRGLLPEPLRTPSGDRVLHGGGERPPFLGVVRGE